MIRKKKGGKKKLEKRMEVSNNRNQKKDFKNLKSFPIG